MRNLRSWSWAFALLALASPAFAQDEAVLWAAGDIAGCNWTGDEATAALLERLGAPDAGWVAALGDLAYPAGTSRQFARCYDPSWGRFRERTLAVAGNHEYYTRKAAGFFGYFGAEAAHPPIGFAAHRIGSWSVYALDSRCLLDQSCLPGGELYARLEAALREDPARCSLVLVHNPRFSSGVHGSNARMQPLWALFQRYGVELVLSGHDHHYERFAPLDAEGRSDPERGTVQFVAGTGGAGLRKLRQRASGSLFADDAHHGVLELTLAEGRYTWRFVSTEDEVLDAGAASCRD
ncbi:metallophosphoesterase family protein [Oceanithermus sp.]